VTLTHWAGRSAPGMISSLTNSSRESTRPEFDARALKVSYATGSPTSGWPGLLRFRASNHRPSDSGPRAHKTIAYATAAEVTNTAPST